MPSNGRKRQKADQKAMKEIIHSGHFMVSDIDDPEVQDGDDNPSLVVHESDCDQENISLPEKGFDFESACKETSKTYTFGSRSTHSISIDASLTKLFECMTLAYSGKLTSPRWKQFKGLKLRLKEKIRLNNMIWRAWHMQFVMKIKTDKLCQFATPLDGDTHMKPEAVVIEGTYWKRRMASITAEYQKWRLFYRDRRLKPSAEADSMAMDLDSRWPSWSKDSYSSLQSAMDEDFIMDFTDTLFSSLNPSQPFDFPNPREIAARAGIADFIQPGLVQLQPSVDDFMDTLEPITDLFSDFLNSRLPPLPEENTYNYNSLQDMLSSNTEQADMFVPSKGSGRNSTNSQIASSSTSSQISSSTLKRNNFRKPISSKSFQQTLDAFSRSKNAIDSLNTGSSNSSVLAENVPLSNPDQSSSSQSNSFMCSNVLREAPENPTIVSLLQSENSSFQPSQNNATSVNLLQPKHEGTSNFFQQAFVSKPFDETGLPQHSVTQANAVVQVPLQTIPQGKIPGQMTGSVISKPNSKDVKNAKQQQQIFFPLNMGQLNQNFNSPGNCFRVPAQVVSPVNVFHSSGAQNVTVVNHVDTPTFRRHSYTTVQNLPTTSMSSGDYMGSRRSRPIAPATSSGNFMIPEVPQQTRHRTRSRSVSSPQSSSPKPMMQPPVQAVSLTDISSSFQSIAPSPDFSLNKQPVDGLQPVNVTNPNILPQNAVLAQLLSTGCNQQDVSQGVIKVTSASTASVTSAVTIIRPILNSSAHTFVFSPLSISSTSGVSDFQRGLLVGATNQVFGSRNSPPTCILPSPDSPGSSTCSSSPAISTISYDSNASKSTRLKSDEEKNQYKEHRRVCHINAEQKRRCNIKNGFEALHNLLPPVGQTPNAKVSKAAMLQRGAEYIRLLKSERQQQLEEAEMLKKQIDELNQAISMYQSQLPASGAPVPCQRTNKMKEMFEEYVREQTLRNWKFWIFSLILEPLVDSFNNNVSTASVDEMCKSILTWLEQHCSLVALRPGVLNSLRYLSTTTNILSDPSCLPEEATQAVTKKESRQ